MELLGHIEDLAAVDSSGFAHENYWGEQLDYSRAAGEAERLLRVAHPGLFAVDVAAARMGQDGRRPVLPLSFVYGPALTTRALQALAHSRAAAAQAGAAKLQTVHLLVGLLTVEGSAARELFDALARHGRPELRPDTLLELLRHRLTEGAGESAAPALAETRSYSRARAGAQQEALRLGASAVDDRHILSVLLRHPGASVREALGDHLDLCVAGLDALFPDGAEGRGPVGPTDSDPLARVQPEKE